MCSTIDPVSDRAVAAVEALLGGVLQGDALARPKSTPVLPVAPALTPVLPGGLARGSTVLVGGSVSLLLALLGAASTEGAWCALVGFGRVSAEAAQEHGVELGRIAFVPAPGAEWLTVVGALLDAVDIVAVRPRSRPTPGDVRRLAARARSKDAVLIPYGTSAEAWPGADLRLHATTQQWSGIENGSGRLRARQLEVRTAGRGRYAQPRRAMLWLPAAPIPLRGLSQARPA